MANSRLESLPPLQRELMDIIWEQNEVTASQVRKLYSKRRDLAGNTVRTVMMRMEMKGWLTHRVVGNTFLYTPALPPEAVAGQTVAEVVDTVCGGSPEVLVEALLENRRLSKQETEGIRKILSQAKGKKAVRKKTGRGKKK